MPPINDHLSNQVVFLLLTYYNNSPRKALGCKIVWFVNDLLVNVQHVTFV